MLLKVLTNARLPLNYGRILKFCFASIHYKIESVSEAFGEVHAPCRIKFFKQQSACFQKYGYKQATYEMSERSYSEIQERN